MKTTTGSLQLLVLLGGAVGLDQLSKAVAVAQLGDGRVISLFFDTLRFQLVHNRSGFLSVFAGIPEGLRAMLLTWGVALLLVAGGLYLLLAKGLPRARLICLALILAGGAANLLDRLSNDGGVVDFMVLGPEWFRTGIFNLADVYILLGSCWLGATLAARHEG